MSCCYLFVFNSCLFRIWLHTTLFSDNVGYVQHQIILELYFVEKIEIS